MRSGMSAGKRPVPIPGSSTRPPRQPSRRSPDQIARDDESGREVGILRAARQRGVVLARRQRLRAHRRYPPNRRGNTASPGRRNTPLARSEAPNPVNLISASCSSDVAGRPAASISAARRMAARLSRARSRQDRARPRSPARWKFSPHREVAPLSASLHRAARLFGAAVGLSSISGSIAKSLAKAVSPKPGESAVVEKRSRVKESSCAMEKLLAVGARQPRLGRVLRAGMVAGWLSG